MCIDSCRYNVAETIMSIKTCLFRTSFDFALLYLGQFFVYHLIGALLSSDCPFHLIFAILLLLKPSMTTRARIDIYILELFHWQPLPSMTGNATSTCLKCTVRCILLSSGFSLERIYLISHRKLLLEYA